MLIAIIIVLGLALSGLMIYIVKTLVAPKKIATLATLVKQNKTAQATKIAKQILLKDPRDPEAHYLLGMAYAADNKHELALMELKTVNQIGRFEGVVQEVPFRTKIAELFIRFNQPEEALKEYLLLLKKDPNNGEFYFLTGRLFEGRNRADKALSYYQKALKLNPRHGETQLRLGQILFRSQRFGDAKLALEAAVKLNPEAYTGYYFLGRMAKDQQDFVSALSYFERATKDPQYKIKALVDRGTCYMSLGELTHAIPEFERAIKLADDMSANDVLYARYFLSICFERTRDLENAITQWELIFQKKPDFKDVAEKLSSYQEMRQDDFVKDYLTAANDEFAEICSQIVAAMGLVAESSEQVDGGYQVVAAEDQKKWRNTKKMPKLVRFFRVGNVIDETVVRAVHETMRKQNLTRAILVSSSGFSRSATEFTESRPLELIGKEKLQSLLKTALS